MSWVTSFRPLFPRRMLALKGNFVLTNTFAMPKSILGLSYRISSTPSFKIAPFSKKPARNVQIYGHRDGYLPAVPPYLLRDGASFLSLLRSAFLAFYYPAFTIPDSLKIEFCKYYSPSTQTPYTSICIKNHTHPYSFCQLFKQIDLV